MFSEAMQYQNGAKHAEGKREQEMRNQQRQDPGVKRKLQDIQASTTCCLTHSSLKGFLECWKGFQTNFTFILKTKMAPVS